MTLHMIKNPSVLLELPDGIQGHVMERTCSPKYANCVQAIFSFAGYDFRIARSTEVEAFTVYIQGRPY
mgnify:CR=1 FL=1